MKSCNRLIASSAEGNATSADICVRTVLRAHNRLWIGDILPGCAGGTRHSASRSRWSCRPGTGRHERRFMCPAFSPGTRRCAVASSPSQFQRQQFLQTMRQSDQPEFRSGQG